MYFRKSKLSRHLLSHSTKNPSLHSSKDNKFEDEQRPSNCIEASKPSLYDKNLKKNADLKKMLKMRKTYAPQILQRETKKSMKTDKAKNLMRIMARHLECHIGWTLGKIMRIILCKISRIVSLILLRKMNGQPNQNLIHWDCSTQQLFSDNRDNEARPQSIKTKAIFKDEQNKNDLVVDLNNNSVNCTFILSHLNQKMETFHD